MNPPDGLLIVDKPAGWTSHDVVDRCRRLCGTRRIGHAGTLDPMATGVLVLGVNKATRLLTFLVGCDKTYTGTIRLGQSTLTDDAEGEVTASYDVTGLTREAVADAVAALTGEIMQVPSSVSAIKVGGQRSYARVRAGQDVALAARPVAVSRFEILRHQPETVPSQAHTLQVLSASGAGTDKTSKVSGTPLTVWDLDIEVDVSSGTYVRALARDLGAALGVGGHLTALRRTRVGRFGVQDAHTLDELTLASEGGVLPSATQPGGARPTAAAPAIPSGAAPAIPSGAAPAIPLVPLAKAARASFPAHELTESEARAVGFGQRVESLRPLRTEPVAAFAPAGHLVAMLDESGALAKAHVVFAPSTS